jgi:hypothetical protein
MQKIFGKTPISFSSGAKALEKREMENILIGIGLAAALGTGIYIGFHVRKKWWPQVKSATDPTKGPELKFNPNEKPKSETFSNFSGDNKLTKRETRDIRKEAYLIKIKNKSISIPDHKRSLSKSN